MTPLDLPSIAGKRWRLAREPGHGRSRDPWLWQIPCRYGHLYPHSDVLLGIATGPHPRIIAQLKRLPGVVMLQGGDDGANLVFSLECLPAVARIVRPRRRRQLTPEQRVAAAERLAKTA